MSWYEPSYFYPVKIGQVYNDKYEVLGKLGHGQYSTIWLCRDLPHNKHVALKVCTLSNVTPGAKLELDVFAHLNAVKSKSSHVGRTLVQTMLDEFKLTTEHGTHQCFVQPPMAVSMQTFRQRFPGRRLPEVLLRETVEHILLALDFLHTEAKVVHTDIQENNILLALADSDPGLQEFERAQKDNPGPHKVVDHDRTIYTSRNIHCSIYGRPTVCDFGEARFIRPNGYGVDIQPIQYRAPEVVLGVPWNEKVDIWSVGVMIWDMFEAKKMFHVLDGDHHGDINAHHLAHMIALLGLPPVDLLQRSNTNIPAAYFDRHGYWKGASEISSDSLEDSEENLRGENKAQFLRFVWKMLRWRPEERSSAKELLEDPWLRSSG